MSTRPPGECGRLGGATKREAANDSLGQDVPADLFLELVELLDMPADGIGLRVLLAGSAEDVNFARNEHLFVTTPAVGRRTRRRKQRRWRLLHFAMRRAHRC